MMKSSVIMILIFSTLSVLADKSDYFEVEIGTPYSSLTDSHENHPAQRDDSHLTCFYIAPKGDFKGVSYMIYKAAVARIDVIGWASTAKIKLPNGVGIGSSKDSVLSIYKDVIISQHKYTGKEYLEVRLGANKGVRFETSQKDIVYSFSIGQYPQLLLSEGCS